MNLCFFFSFFFLVSTHLQAKKEDPGTQPTKSSNRNRKQTIARTTTAAEVENEKARAGSLRFALGRGRRGGRSENWHHYENWCRPQRAHTTTPLCLLLTGVCVCVCGYVIFFPFQRNRTVENGITLPHIPISTRCARFLQIVDAHWTRSNTKKVPGSGEGVGSRADAKQIGLHPLYLTHTHNGDLSVELDAKRSKGIRSFSDTKWTHIFEIITNHTMKMQQSDPFSLDLFTVRDLWNACVNRLRHKLYLLTSLARDTFEDTACLFKDKSFWTNLSLRTRAKRVSSSLDSVLVSDSGGCEYWYSKSTS